MRETGTREIRPASTIVAIHSLEHPTEAAGPEALASARLSSASITKTLVYKGRSGVSLLTIGSSHSESGILKAKWSMADYKEMLFIG